MGKIIVYLYDAYGNLEEGHPIKVDMSELYSEEYITGNALNLQQYIEVLDDDENIYYIDEDIVIEMSERIV